MTIPKDFDPKKFDSVPRSYQDIFDPDSFNSSALHTEAEKDARELIVQALTTRYAQPCHSVENMRNPGYLRRNNITLEMIRDSKVKLV